MEKTTHGWVIQNDNHPSGKAPYIMMHTFSATRQETINSFAEGTGMSWNKWRDNWNFKCVRASTTISTL